MEERRLGRPKMREEDKKLLRSYTIDRELFKKVKEKVENSNGQFSVSMVIEDAFYKFINS